MKNVFLKFFIALVLTTVYSLPLAAQYKQWNNALGIPFLNNNGKWTRESFEQAMYSAARLRFSGNKQLRMARSQKKILGIIPKEIRASYNAQGQLTVIDVIYNNKGDDGKQKNVRKIIRTTARTLEKKITAEFGIPLKRDYGHKKMDNNALKWKSYTADIFLEYVGSEFVMLHICFLPTDTVSKNKPKEARALKDVSENVKSTVFGDVYIENIPMIDQGSKGYCVPATVERVLKYYGINNINMHQLADVAKTGKGGGTYTRQMFSSISSVCNRSGLKMIKTGDVKMKMIKKYIDQGIPIFWSMYNNQQYNELRRKNSYIRTKAESPKAWSKQIEKMRVSSSGEGHMCLIIGYNEQTGELAVSNSWGDHEIPPSWVPMRIASTVSQGQTVVLLPR